MSNATPIASSKKDLKEFVMTTSNSTVESRIKTQALTINSKTTSIVSFMRISDNKLLGYRIETI